MAREKIDNKLNVVIGTKAQVEADNTIPENSIIVVTDEDLKADEIVYSIEKNVQEAIEDLETNKVTSNAAITGATKTKVTYDEKGLVTGGTDLVESDVPPLSASKITSGQFPVDRMPRAASGFLKAAGTGTNPSYSTLVEADIPSLNASKITAGTFADARIASASTWNSKVGEAPTDSKAYVRVDGAWVAVTVTTVTW